MTFENMRKWIGKKDRNLWVSLFLLIFSTRIAIEAYRLGLGSVHSPGPGFMMFGASSLLGLLSLHLFLKFLMTQESIRRGARTGKYWKRVIAVFIAFTIYIYLFDPLGYLLTTFFFMVFLLKLLGSRRWVFIVAGAAFISLVTYQVFSLWFALNFPKGVIRFF